MLSYTLNFVIAKPYEISRPQILSLFPKRTGGGFFRRAVMCINCIFAGFWPDAGKASLNPVHIVNFAGKVQQIQHAF